jgi:putative tryptophan/tyrosine transport system substrate-binding protein
MTARGYIKRQPWERPAVIGFLGATKHSAWSEFVPPFEQRLRELGWIDGHNLEIDFRWADGQADRYQKIAKAFVDRGVDIIVTAGTPAVVAAKKATKATPIVFAAAGDPVRTGLVRSFAHPGGNITGLSNGQTDLAGKRLELLREAVPHLKELAIMGNRASDNVRLEMDALQKSARKLGIGTVIVDVRNEPQIAPAIKRLKGKADALYVCTDPFVTHHRVTINTLATSAGLPTMQAFRHHTEGGGLISYGPDFRNMFGQAADLVDKILRGTKPANIPVKQEKKCELVVNLNTAKALGLKIPGRVRRRAATIR